MRPGFCVLGHWIDAEHDTLGRVLVQARQKQTATPLETLEQPHLRPDAKTESEVRNGGRTCEERALIYRSTV